MENDQLLEKALSQIPLQDRQDIPPGGMNEYLQQVVEKFIVEQIKNFPVLCQETRQINRQHNQELEIYGIKSPLTTGPMGTFGGTTGWSRDRNMKHKWIIPTQLKFFMRNVIYINFWDDSNAKVRDSFMRALLRGDEPFTLLEKVRHYYGTRSGKFEFSEVAG